ncbi:MAG: glucose-6-phosphate dehydrogenase [Anaerorhabdus sp.]
MSGKIKTNFTIFGGTGDLTYRKLIPALYNLYATKKITSDDRIVAIGRREYQLEEYHEIIKDWVSKYSRIKFDETTFHNFLKQVDYFKMDFTNLEEYKRLEAYYKQKEIENHIFYYAVAPSFFSVISDGIISISDCKNEKIIIEKPFGETLENANEISKKLEACFGEDHIYRIDHYLGKEMVRSIQTLRFTNPIFANSWNNKNIDNVQIIAHEEGGVETRGNYYDKVGALKDMVQNHLMQIMTLVAMEKPDATHSIHDRQIEVLKTLRPVNRLDMESSMILAQYEGYKNEVNVDPHSTTETFAACKLFIDSYKWDNVPFYIKTGKKMSSREMNVIITFRPLDAESKPNVLTIKIQPLEGVSLKFNIKRPGESEEVIQTEMDFCQSCIPSHRINTPEAYERLLEAVVNSEQTWFSKWDQIYLSWKYIEQLKEKYSDLQLPIYSYNQNTDGPEEAIQIMEDDSQSWGESQLACKR